MRKKKLSLNKKKIAFWGLLLLLVVWIAVWSFKHFMPMKIAGEPILIPPDTISEHDMAVVNNRLLLVNTKGVMAYGKDGDYKWDCAVKTAEPFMETENGYVAVADTGNGVIHVLNGGKIDHIIEEKQTVSGICINKNGYIASASEEHGYRSVVHVYDRYGNKVYSWYSNQFYVTALALSDDNRYMAVAGINPEANDLESVITFLDLKSETPKGQVMLQGSIAYKLVYGGNRIYVLADNGVYAYDNSGALKHSYAFLGRNLHAFVFDNKDNLVLALSRTDAAGSMLAGSDVVVLNTKLKEKQVTGVDFEVEALDSKDGFIAVTGLRHVLLMEKGGRIRAAGTLNYDCKNVKLFEKGKGFATLSGSTIGIYSVHYGF